MDRNPTLSRIGGTTPGQVTFDRAFLTKLLTYAGIPILGLVATQFPASGKNARPAHQPAPADRGRRVGRHARVAAR